MFSGHTTRSLPYSVATGVAGFAGRDAGDCGGKQVDPRGSSDSLEPEEQSQFNRDFSERTPGLEQPSDTSGCSGAPSLLGCGGRTAGSRVKRQFPGSMACDFEQLLVEPARFGLAACRSGSASGAVQAVQAPRVELK